MRIGYIQNSPIYGKKEENFNQVRELVKGVEADLLVLPELFATGYLLTSGEDVKNLAETSDGETAKFLKEISSKTGAVIVAGFIEEEDGKYYNSSIMVHNNELIDTYRKIHLFKKETLLFSPGNKELSAQKVNGMKIGMMICFDWIFPEVSRTLAVDGSQIITRPSNSRITHGQEGMVTRSRENRVFSITANRVGTEKRGEDEITFNGGSQITSFDGEILSSASKNEMTVDVVEIDVTKADNKMINKFNDLLKDRKKEFYR